MSQSYDLTRPNTPTNVQPEQSPVDERRQMGRRALIAAAGLGVVGVAAYEAPKIMDAAGNLTQAEIDKAIAYGRQQLAKELLTVEEIGIDIAVDVSNITHGAVDLFVIPIAKLLANLTEITLDVAHNACQAALNLAGLVGIDRRGISYLDTIIQQWKTNVDLFPVAISNINNADTKSANTYLTGLKKKLENEAASSK